MDETALSIENLSVAYSSTLVLHDFSVRIPKGLLVGIVGPNGAGKSTLLKVCCGMIPKLSGKIQFFNKPLEKFRKKIAFVPQRSSVEWNFPITVFEVVLMGSYPSLGLFKAPSQAKKQQAKKMLQLVGLEGFEEVGIAELSGGQQQRVFVARALMQEAEVFFFDEPFAGIDVASERQILHIFKQLQKEGKTLFIVHHDISAWGRYFDWLILLNKELISYGPTAQVLTKEHLQKAYKCPADFFPESFLEKR